jgi:predicted Na+-dependent transporter
MNKVTCPFCNNLVPYGAKVCSGCFAEIEYKTPVWAYFIALIMSIVAGWKFINVASFSFPYGVAVSFTVFIFFCFVLNRFFADRVNFERTYRV